ncbi:TonB family protein [Rhodoferax sp.]|uniref:energy transducer TonB n=1 Tax=Rhodoferax sp. TaxID=50421 RepID=UPI0028437AE8|nr:TonB family protein [Rhodoferax sp.]MDR3369334.1 TonB family protein [Rhodoferax sp.]
MSRSQRHLLIASSVVLFHLAAIWVLQTGLIRQALAVVVPVEILSEFIEPPKPQPEPPLQPPKPVVQAVPRPTAPPPPPMPLAIADPTPAPDAPTGVVAPPVPLPPIAAPVAATPTPKPVPAGPQIELPSSDADYLHNPPPNYPAKSRRMGEQGKVVVRVLIGVDGLAQKVEIRKSSGFDRLDEAALDTVKNWRYVPGKRAGVVEAMWFNVPINYVLE